MGGKSKQETNSSQNTSTGPWIATQGALGDAIRALEPLTKASNINANPAENMALQSIQQNAAGIPNYTGQATGLFDSLFSGGTDRTGIVNDAYSQYQKALTPYAQGQYLDPRSAPGMSDVLDTIRGDVANKINGLFGGAGRDLSGAHTQALARGISQGEAVPLLNQYNQNVQNQIGAAGSLFGAGGTTAGLLSGLDQTALGNQLTGLSAAPSIGNANVGSNAQLQAEQLQRGLPLSNLGQALNLLLPIAGLGSEGNSTGHSTTYNTASPMQTALGWSGVFKNFFPGGF